MPSPPPPHLLTSTTMADNTLLMTHSHLPDDGSTLGLFPSIHFPDTGVGSNPDASESPRHIDPLSDICHQNQAPFSRVPLLYRESTPWIGVTGRSPQGIFEEITMLDPTSATNPSYPVGRTPSYHLPAAYTTPQDMQFDLGLHSTTDGSSRLTADWPVFPYPLNWGGNVGVDGSSFGTRVREMESQSILATSRPNRSPSSVSPDPDILTLRSGPSHTPSNSDHHDHCSPDLWSYPQERISSHGLVRSDLQCCFDWQ